jgi:hypothetical protein
MKSFGDVIDSVETLSLDDQEDLVAILQRRLRDNRRAELVRAVKAARKEFSTGRCKPTTVDEIIQKIIP